MLLKFGKTCSAVFLFANGRRTGQTNAKEHTPKLSNNAGLKNFLAP